MAFPPARCRQRFQRGRSPALAERWRPGAHAGLAGGRVLQRSGSTPGNLPLETVSPQKKSLCAVPVIQKKGNHPNIQRQG